MFTVDEEESIVKLLSQAVRPRQPMTIEGLHGFLFGLAITPEPVMPSEWLPEFFGEEVAQFASSAEANETLGQLLSAFHRICLLNQKDELAFPFDMDMLREEDLDRIGQWSYGLYLAMCLRLDIWGMDEEESAQQPDLSEDERLVLASCTVVLGVAVPESIPELFSDTPPGDPDITATLFAALPEAVLTLRRHANELRLGLRRPKRKSPEETETSPA